MEESRKKQIADQVMPNLRFYKDFPKPGVNFLDIFSATENPEVMVILKDAMIELLTGQKFTHIVGIESKGFVIGPILAMHYKVPFVAIRKKGKLPGECHQ